VIEYRTGGKRLLDVALSLLVVVLTVPVWLLAAVGLAVQNGGKLFFVQERPCRYARAFHILKFKTMTDARDEDGNLLPDNQRITRLGRVVRQWSVDELPQLINVLRGDTSLVGPRPLLFKYLPLYSPDQYRRHEVRPGITGWAQVNGRNALSWNEKFRLDVEYVDQVSFVLDVRIALRTVQKILVREGINQSDARPMEPFNGSN
jgi:lipopolysaccharide/colanic/teichoic acid biosynthesis glycosyltransferase